MNPEEDHLIGQFLKGELSSEEEGAFRMRLDNDPELKERVILEQQLLGVFDEADWSTAEKGDSEEVKEYEALFGSDEAKKIKSAITLSRDAYHNGNKKSKIRGWWMLPSAAAILLLVAFYFLRPVNNSPQNLYETYIQKTELPDFTTRGVEDNEAELLKGLSYFNNKQFVEAAQVYSNLLEGSREMAGLYIYLAVCQIQLGEFDKAEVTLDKLIGSDLIDAQKGFWYKSLLHLKSGELAKSQKELKSIVDNAYYNYQLAESLLKELE